MKPIKDSFLGSVLPWFILFFFFIGFMVYFNTIFIGSEEDETDKEMVDMPVPFSMYDWRVGTSDNTITVADICGKDAEDNNVFLHVRDLGTDRELWFKIGDGVGLRWRIGYERITYTIKFSTEDYTVSHSSACTCVHNENGNVLKIDYPQNILKLLYKEDKFTVHLLCGGKVVGLYRFDAIKPLELD
jgi:hypothetical protein